MSLTTKKTINSIALEASSVINGVEVLKLSTQVSGTSSYSNVAQTVLDQTAYNANKAAVRKDILEFSDVIFDAQDELDSSADDSAASSVASSSAASSASSAAE